MNIMNMDLSVWVAKLQFGGQLPDYYEDMANLLETSKDIRQLEIFQSDAQRYEGSSRGLLSEIWAARYIEMGADLARTWDGFMPSDDVAIIRVQQDLGSDAIVGALKDLAKTSKIKRELLSAAQSTVGMGLISMAVAVSACVFMPSWGVGMLSQAFEVSTELWGSVGRRLAAWAAFMDAYGLFLFGALAVAFAWVIWSLNGWTGPGRDWADRKLLLYRVYHEMFGIRTALTMATLTRKNGGSMLTLRSAMEVLSGNTRSEWKQWQLHRVIEKIDTTGAASAEVFGTGIFTQQMYWRLLDVTRAKPLSDSFVILSTSIQALYLPRLIRQMTVWRWILMIAALLIVIALVGSFQATVFEMKTVMMNQMSPTN